MNSTTVSHASKVASLVRFLLSHDCTLSAVANNDGTITVSNYAWDRNNVRSVETTTLEANLTACRDWLGY